MHQRFKSIIATTFVTVIALLLACILLVIDFYILFAFYLSISSLPFLLVAFIWLVVLNALILGTLLLVTCFFDWFLEFISMGLDYE